MAASNVSAAWSIKLSTVCTGSAQTQAKHDGETHSWDPSLGTRENARHSIMVVSVVAKYMQAYKQFGLRAALTKMYTVGDIKFGDLKGEDSHGNKYFENKDYPYGQHRWVEYADIHDYDSSSVTAAWHPWLHHMSDHTPSTAAQLPEMKPIEIAVGQHTPHNDFVAPGRVDDVNRSTWRPRGAGVGNIWQEPGEPDMYYKQPGHPQNKLSDKGGRFSKQKSMETWDPADPKGENTKKPIRELTEV